MKKSLLAISVLSLCGTLLASGIPLTYASSTTPVNAVTMMSMPQKGGQSDPSKGIKNVAEINSFVIENNQIKQISGAISYKGTNIPFNLTGTLYKGMFAGRINGIAHDTSGNFDVVRFEILPSSSNGILMTSFGKKINGDILALYLAKKGTRDLTMIETPLTTVMDSTSISSLVSQSMSFSSAPADAVLWFEKFFKPDVFTKMKGASTTGSSSPNKLATANQISPMTSNTTVSQNINFSTRYYLLGYNVDDYMTINEFLTEPTDTSGAPEGKLSIQSTEYHEEGGNTYYNGETGFQLGYNAPGVNIQLTVPSPEGIQYQWVSGQVDKSPSWTIQYSFTLGWHGFGATPAASGGGDSALNGGGNSPDDGAYYGSYTVPSGDIMTYTGDYIDVLWKALRYTGRSGSSTAENEIDFTYNVFNRYDNTFNYIDKDPYTWYLTVLS